MTDRDIASAVLGCVGGVGNVIANSLCMTRLRITVANPTAVNRESLDLIDGVLGTATRGTNGIEVVFGPRTVQGVFDAFSKLTGIPSDFDPLAGFRRQVSNLHVHITPGRRKSYSAQADANEQLHRLQDESDEVDEDMLALERLLDEGIDAPETPTPAPAKLERRVLVINGPNINMVGIREPELYGREDYPSMLELCKVAAREAGFVDCRCYQSNHEGDLVDEIQDAYQVFDGIIINPGAYTHTSIALLDAVKAVSIPTIEVHISKVEDREDFRQISYLHRDHHRAGHRGIPGGHPASGRVSGDVVADEVSRFTRAARLATLSATPRHKTPPRQLLPRRRTNHIT